MNSIDFNGQRITPGKIVCVGRNYVAHIEELNNEIPEQIVIFNKPASAISEQLTCYQQEAIHFEAELCFLMRQQRPVGVGFGLDLTKRELQSQLKSKGLPWERAKAFNGSAVFSKFITLNSHIDALSFSLHIDGQLQQQGDPLLMMFKPEEIIADLAEYMPLQDHDILMTGTPKGVGQLQKGATYIGRVYANDEVIIEQQWNGE